MYKKAINGYVLDKIIGSGSYAEVYKGKHIKTKELVAIKKFNKHVYDNPSMLDRLTSEIEAMQKLDSPRIIKVIDIVQSGSGNIYCIMELCKGGSLLDLVHQHGALSEQNVVKWLGQILEAFDVMRE